MGQKYIIYVLLKKMVKQAFKDSGNKYLFYAYNKKNKTIRMKNTIIYKNYK